MMDDKLRTALKLVKRNEDCLIILAHCRDHTYIQNYAVALMATKPAAGAATPTVLPAFPDATALTTASC